MRLSAQMVCAGIALAAAAIWAGAARAAEVVSTTNPYAGVVYTVYLDKTIPARIHVVEIDLRSSGLSLRATAPGERGTTVPAFAAAVGADIAVNGDLFSPIDMTPDGLAMGDATLWPKTADDAKEGFIRFDESGGRSHVALSEPAMVVSAADLPAGTTGVVGGRPLLVSGGVAASSFDCSDAAAMPCERAPRSAVALSPDGNTLWLVAVDGWQQSSAGMTAGELAGFLAGAGAESALMLDGGGASTLYIKNQGGLVNAPSDGVARNVANALAVEVSSTPGADAGPPADAAPPAADAGDAGVPTDAGAAGAVDAAPTSDAAGAAADAGGGSGGGCAIAAPAATPARGDGQGGRFRATLALLAALALALIAIRRGRRSSP